MKVRGTGPVPCEIALIGPYPGTSEDKTGIPFSPGETYRSGRKRHTAGDELDRYLNGGDLPTRDDIYLTNLHDEYRGRDYVYTKEDEAVSVPRLMSELQRVLPKVIITMGREVTRLFLGDVDISDVEGIPWLLPDDCTMYPCPPSGVVVFPLTHIAAGMRNPNLSPYVVRGFRELAEYLDGNIPARRLYDDPHPKPTYLEVDTMERLLGLMVCWRADTRLAIDTEGWPGKPWSLQFSWVPGWSYLIRGHRTDLLKAFFDRIHQVPLRLVFHPYLHEAPMARALGFSFEGIPYDDTRVMAYLLSLEPQGLKAGCLRHCNMRMSDYTDIIGDTANELARDYLTWIWEAEYMEWEAACEAEFVRLTTTPFTDARGKLQPGRRLKVHPKLPKSPLHKACERVMRSEHPHRLWEDQVEDVQVAGYRRLGPLPQATLDYVPAAVSIPYGCRDADGTGRLLPEYERRLDGLGLRGVYELELGANPILDRMQQIGILPDLPHFAQLSDLLAAEIDRLRAELVDATGRDTFNANSGDQVAEYLFGTLGLEEVKMTSGGRGSTNDKILEALEHEHPEHTVITDIRAYREIYKLKNTFVDRLRDYANRWPYDSRIHTTLRTTSVVTGRLAAADPNMLAMPKHGKFAKKFRRGWIAAEGHYLGEWDLSQIELRIGAHLSQDPYMLAIFRGEVRNPDGSKIDLHAGLGQRIFGIPKKDQTNAQRTAMKAINFGFWMGQTENGLQVELRKNGVPVDLDDAKKWLDEANKTYKGAQPYKDRMIAEARRNGFIRCLSGRIRYIGGIRSRDDRIREEAERFAFSTPVQEGAQWLMKLAEARIYHDVLQYYWAKQQWVEPILQVHDALTLEFEDDRDLGEEINALMVDILTTTPKGFSVPVETSGDYGRTWCAFDPKDPHDGDMVPFED